jgi:hypothetical protein
MKRRLPTLARKLLQPNKNHFLVYLLAWMSWYIGFSFAGPGGVFVGLGESILHNSGVLIQRELWGLVLGVSSTAILYGLYKSKDKFVVYGGMVGFLLWLFAALSMALAGHWYVFVTVTMLHCSYHAYLYLVATVSRFGGSLDT